MNNKYFENIEGIGALYLQYVFYEFEHEPILFVCENIDKELFLCLCSDIRYEQKWIISKTNIMILKMLVDNRIDIATAFLKQEKLFVNIMDLKGDEESVIINRSELDRLDLPKEGTYVKDNDDNKTFVWKKELENIIMIMNKLFDKNNGEKNKAKEVIETYTLNVNASNIKKDKKLYSIDINEEVIENEGIISKDIVRDCGKTDIANALIYDYKKEDIIKKSKYNLEKTEIIKMNVDELSCVEAA